MIVREPGDPDLTIFGSRLLVKGIWLMHENGWSVNKIYEAFSDTNVTVKDLREAIEYGDKHFNEEVQEDVPPANDGQGMAGMV